MCCFILCRLLIAFKIDDHCRRLLSYHEGDTDAVVGLIRVPVRIEMGVGGCTWLW